MIARPLMSFEEMSSATKSPKGQCPSEALHEESGENLVAYDDLSGDLLDPLLMQKARREEIVYFKEMGVYDKVAIKEVYDVTGKAPIAVRWVDVNKGDSQNPKYRSRLVAKEFNTGVNHDLYAATPPSECLRLMRSILASGRSRGMTLMYADVSRAYFYAKAERPVYVKLPAEDLQPGDENKCGRLRMSMYGTRDAALNWSKEYAGTLKSAGFEQGKSNPCLFRHRDLEVAIMVHGDDFIAVGSEENLKATRAVLENKYKIKVEVLGTKPGQTRELRILNKVVRLAKSGIELEADPRHVEFTIRDLGLENAKVSTVPGAKESKPRGSTPAEDLSAVDSTGRGGEWQDSEIESAQGGPEECQEEDDPLLPKAEATLYRAVAARLNYLAPDRPDIAYSVKEAARAMSAPKQSHMLKIKKLGKYLKGRPRLVSLFKWQALPKLVTTFTDSDWAGCLKSAKSTSGGIVCLGEHAIKTYSKQQKVVALSSAEAELYAMVLASAETIAVQAYAADLGIQLGGELYTDSSAALGIAKRAGIGKVRHLRTQGLWVQEVRVSGRIVYKKVLGEKNPSDLLTKYMAADLSMRHLTAINAGFVNGRAESAPEIGSLEDTTLELEVDVGDGGLLSWIRKQAIVFGQKVRFRPLVEVRPIPAVGAGKSCRGPERKKKRGRWPAVEAQRPGPSSVGIQKLDSIAPSSTTAASSVDAASSERIAAGELAKQNDEDIDRESGSTAAGSRLHEPRRPAVHVCGIGSGRHSWREALSDSEDEIVECAACQEACSQLESPGQAPSRWRTPELAGICSLGIGSGECDRGRASGGCSGSEDEEYVCEDANNFAPGFSGEQHFGPVREGQNFFVDRYLGSDRCHGALNCRGNRCHWASCTVRMGLIGRRSRR